MTCRCLACTIFLLALWGRPLFAEEITSDIKADTTWTIAASPYLVGGDISVLAGATLTIEPGVEVRLNADSSIIVAGQLVARGAQDADILFTAADDATRWQSVHFTDSSIDASFDQVDAYASGSLLERCIFEHATHALWLEGASPYVHNCTFRFNATPFSVDVVGGAAMLVQDGSSPRIRGCEFTDNLADGLSYGGAVYVDSSDPIIQDNAFTRNQSMYGGALCTTLTASPIVGNLFQDNVATGSEYSKGGALSLISSVCAILDNDVSGNSSTADGGGFHICVDCHPHATPFILGNRVTGNEMTGDEPSHGAAGVGAGYLRRLSGNTISGNFRAGEPADFGWYHPLEEGLPDWAANVSVAGNWWGTMPS